MDLRRLCYRDRFTGYLKSVINTEDTRTINEELALTDESQFLVLEVTAAQYNRLFNAIMTGADLVYGDEAHDVMWPFWRAATVGTFCEAVNACVANGGNGGGGGTPSVPLVPPVLDKDLLPADFECDQDHAYGMARAVVEAINEGFMEFLQKIELATNPLELATELTDNVPIASVAATAGEVLNWMQDTIGEIYVAAWSDASRDAIACEIYCKIMEECTISYSDVFAIYWEGFADLPDLDNADWWTWIDWLFQITPSTNEATVKVGGMIALIAMRFGGHFTSIFDLGIYSFETVVQLAKDEQSSDWSTICDACPDPEWIATTELDNVSALPGLCSLEGRGIFEEGVGITDVCQTDGSDRTESFIRMNASFDLTKIDIYYELANCSGAPPASTQGAITALVGESKEYEILRSSNFGGFEQGASVYGVEAERAVNDNVQVFIRSCYFRCAGSVTITKVRIWGSGTNPFESEDGWTIN